MDLEQTVLLIALMYFNQYSKKNILLVCAAVVYIVYLTVYVNPLTNMAYVGFEILLIAYLVLSAYPGGKKK